LFPDLAWDDVVQAALQRRERPQTIETTPGLARVDGMAQGFVAQEVLVFEIDAEIGQSYGAGRGLFRMVRENLFGQAHVHDAPLQKKKPRWEVGAQFFTPITVSEVYPFVKKNFIKL
jgi:hypothetical protein